MFAREWREHGHCHENYHAVTGEGHDVKDSDPFYGWGALLPLMRVEDALFPSPWEGMCVATDRGPCLRGTLWSGRVLRLEGGNGREGAWRLTLDGRPELAGDRPCRLSGLRIEADALELTVESPGAVTLSVPRLAAEHVLHATLPQGAELTFDPRGARLALAAGRHAAKLALSRDLTAADGR
jgi:putative isomerase